MEHKPDWVYVEIVNPDKEQLSIGLETYDKIERQLNVDLCRMHISIDNHEIKNIDDLFKEVGSFEQNTFRSCTQSIFVSPMERIVELFPLYFIVHNKDVKNRVLLTDVAYPSMLEWMGISSHKPHYIYHVYVSFKALHKSNLKHIYNIHTEFVLDWETAEGSVIFQVEEISQ